MKKAVRVILAVFLVMPFTGCAAIMAVKQPSKKNLSVLDSGTSRENVVTYLGAPVTTETKNGEKIEIYQFTQGYKGGVKAARAVFHITADLFTIFIWELVGIPAELIANGEKMSVKVTYDENERVKDFVYLSQPG